jgi:nicotinate-nucleotide adenylyltransferase
MKRIKHPRIGIFGGTFDPPHNGHLAIARQALKQFHLRTVFFVPAYVPPHKQNKNSTSPQHRLSMVRYAVKGNARFKVSAIELKRGGVSYTVDTLAAFKKRFPRAEFVLIIGADNLLQFHRWKDPARIAELAHVAVYRRMGYRLPRQKDAIAFERIKGQLFKVSSTEVRSRIMRGKSAALMLPTNVLRYIQRHGLFSSKETS